LKRSAPVRLHYHNRSRNVSILDLPAIPPLNRIVDRSGKVMAPPPEGILLSKTLAEILQVSPGDRVQQDVLEGACPVREAVVAGLVDEFLGLSVYMNQEALHRLMRESEKLQAHTYREIQGSCRDYIESLK
jgi:putative ABC transport system permease protein